MRRVIFLSLGGLEAVAAGILAFLAFILPGTEEVRESTQRVGAISGNAEEQVQGLRARLGDVRARQPRLKRDAERLKAEMAHVKESLEKQQLDPAALAKMNDSLGRTADDLQDLGDVFTGEDLGRLGTALGRAADYLDRDLAPGAEALARRLEGSARQLRADAVRLRDQARGGVVDVVAVRELSDALSRFAGELDRLEKDLRTPAAEAALASLQRLGNPLDEAADRLNGVASISYPDVKMHGYQPVVVSKPLWPEGKALVAALRRAAAETGGLERQLGSVSRDLPRLRASVAETRAAVDRTRAALADAAGHEEHLGEALKAMPDDLERLVRQVADLQDELARALDGARQLHDAADQVRAVKRQVEGVAGRAPKVRTGLDRLADILRKRQADLRELIDHPASYRTSLANTLKLLDAVAAALPPLTDNLDNRLEREDQSLEQLEHSVHQVTVAMPDVSRTACRVLIVTRLLLCVGAAIFGVHGGYLFLVHLHGFLDHRPVPAGRD